MVTAGALVLVVAATGACGRKTDPLTPDSPRPEAVKEIKIAVRDVVAYLSWPVPAKNVEGKTMGPADIKGFRIYRAEQSRERKRPLYRQVAEIGLADPAPAQVQNGIVTWNDTGLQYGKVYVYRIRAYSVRGGASGYSDEVRAAPLLSLAAPKNPKAAGWRQLGHAYLGTGDRTVGRKRPPGVRGVSGLPRKRNRENTTTCR